MSVSQPLPTPLSTSPTPPAAASKTPQSGLHTRVYSAQDLISKTALSNAIRGVVNLGYTDRKIYPEKDWIEVGDRLKTPAALRDALGLHGRVAAVFSGEDEVDPVACACMSPWKGDLFPSKDDTVAREAPKEEGWEIKGVATKNGWNKMGLIGQCISALTRDVAQRQREAKVRLWVHQVEEVNGEYWRRRGFKEVRRRRMEPGVWSSRFGFQIVAMYRDVNVDDWQWM